MIVTIHIPGPPVPKARARKGRGGHWYTPEATRAYERHVRLHAIAARPSTWPLDRQYEVTARIYFPDRRRRDGDNVMKSLLDAGIGTLWRDDSQVKGRYVTDHVDRDKPRVEMEVAFS